MPNLKATHRKPSPRWLSHPKEKLIFILVFTVAHVLLTLGLFYWNYSSLLANMQTGAALTPAGQVLIKVSEAFQWPLIISLAQNQAITNLPTYSFYIVVLLNSLLWALVALLLIILVQALTKPRHLPRKLGAKTSKP